MFFRPPARAVVNSAFYTMALHSGLDCAIVNPMSSEIMQSYRAFCALMALDPSCANYIAAYAEHTADQPAAAVTELTLPACIEKGLKDEARAKTAELLNVLQPL